jgi:hypothetical protein
MPRSAARGSNRKPSLILGGALKAGMEPARQSRDAFHLVRELTFALKPCFTKES